MNIPVDPLRFSREQQGWGRGYADGLDWKEHHHGHHPEVQSLCQKKKKGKMQRLPAAHLKKKTRVQSVSVGAMSSLLRSVVVTD